MERSGSVLLLLVTSVVAIQYRWQAAVSLPGPAVQTTSAVSRFACALRCEKLPPESCSGFTYAAGDGTCRLFSGDCRGPAADSSQQTTDRYMARLLCSDIPSNRCGCPAGFTRCAGRCLALLDQRVDYIQAESLCAELGAHLAVPRSQAENQCAMTAIGDHLGWLGITDVATEGQWIGADGCGVVLPEDQRWADGEPDTVDYDDYVVLVPGSAPYSIGWHDNPFSASWLPLCQLPLCYQASCQ